MLYIGYLIILNSQNIKKKSVSEISIFELLRVENCMSRLSPSPLGCPSPPKHPNSVKTPQRGPKTCFK